MIYCEDCRYFKLTFSRILKKSVMCRKTELPAMIKNKHNDCMHYKRKFWKFWLNES